MLGCRSLPPLKVHDLHEQRYLRRLGVRGQITGLRVCACVCVGGSQAANLSEGEDAVCRGIKQTCPPMFRVFSLKSWSISSLNGCIAFFLLIHDWML